MSTPHLTRSEKADLWATGIAGLLTIGAAIGIGVIRMLDLFPVSGGITVTAPVTSAAPTQSLGSVQAQPTMLEFTAQDVNALSVGALITEIILTALGYPRSVPPGGHDRSGVPARGPAFPQGTAKLVNAIAIVLIAMSAGGTFVKVLGYDERSRRSMRSTCSTSRH